MQLCRTASRLSQAGLQESVERQRLDSTCCPAQAPGGFKLADNGPRAPDAATMAKLRGSWQLAAARKPAAAAVLVDLKVQHIPHGAHCFFAQPYIMEGCACLPLAACMSCSSCMHSGMAHHVALHISTTGSAVSMCSAIPIQVEGVAIL